MKQIFAISLLLCAWCAVVRAESGDYEIDWYSLDCGGGASADEVYAISGTIGQPNTDEVGDDIFTILSGFWAAAIETSAPTPPKLTVNVVGDIMVLTWPASVTGFYLEQNFELTQPGGWSPVNQPVVVSNDCNTVTVLTSDRLVYYRLTDTPTPLRLVITRSGTNLVLYWPASATGYFLEQSSDVSQPNGWSLVGLSVSAVNGLNTVTISTSSGRSFYRLSSAPTGPSLRIEPSADNGVLISWSANSADFHLEQNAHLATTNWTNLTNKPAVNGGRIQVTLPISGTEAFFRLKHP